MQTVYGLYLNQYSVLINDLVDAGGFYEQFLTKWFGRQVMFEVYKPSGAFGVSTFFYLLIGLVGAVVLAPVYAYGLYYIPYLVCSFALTAFFVVALEILGSMVVVRGHCRNPLLAGLIALLLCVFGLTAKHYVQYGLWLTQETEATLEREISEGKSKPSDADVARKEIHIWLAGNFSFLGHFKERANQGFTIDGAPITGVLMYLIWATEFGLGFISGLTGLFSPVRAAKQPYSEKLDMWANETEEVMQLPISSDKMVEQIKSATRVEELLEIPIPKSLNPQNYALYKVHSVPGVELEDAYLSVSLHETSVDKDGNAKVKETKLVSNAILTSEQRAQLLENASLMKEALADYRRAVVKGRLGEEDVEG